MRVPSISLLCSPLTPSRSLGEGGHSGSELSGSLRKDMGDASWRLLTEALSSIPNTDRPLGRDDRGVKNLPNLRGVTDGFRLSFRRVDLVGDSIWLAGEDALAGGLEGTASDAADGP